MKTKVPFNWYVGFGKMNEEVLSLDIRRIVTDSDLDGVVTGAILRRYWNDAEIIFGHPGELRAGILDHLIDDCTAVCDLPRHPQCGLSIDHHLSNRPEEDLNFEGVVVWDDAPSAARIAYNILSETIDLTDLEELLIWVDKFDSGGITKEEYLSKNSIFWLAKMVGINSDIALYILESLQNGKSVESILTNDIIIPHLSERRSMQKRIEDLIDKKMIIVNRLAIVRFEDSGMRSNGYHITAKGGEGCDACIVIHGDVGSSFGQDGKYPVSASFYTNSFIHKEGGIYDLTKMATKFDPDGGGHANACGCRIKPLENGNLTIRDVELNDIEENLYEWIKMWNNK
mgnify:CR=1 FL=1